MLAASRASSEPGKLLIADGEPYTAADLAHYANLRTRDVQDALPKMLRLGMIVMEEDVIVIKNWHEYQYESDTSTSRVRAYRNKRKEHPRNVTTLKEETLQRRSTERYRNVLDTETEAETDSRWSPS